MVADDSVLKDNDDKSPNEVMKTKLFTTMKHHINELLEDDTIDHQTRQQLLQQQSKKEHLFNTRMKRKKEEEIQKVLKDNGM